ncbi:transcription initiation factor IIA large subunit [Trichomonascus vanleenenianus]|uniref:transcription initiation factor IIA large subunit n=1 Tax=Trichomonascus vanleenenianus TaxID=2268995 RepID=UPI003ECA7F60
MSNDAVGQLYDSIINGVINESRMDFEDSGVDEATLQEMKMVWQEKLSALKVAKMAWDPEPQPEYSSTLPPAPQGQPPQLQQPQAQSQPPQQIKQEPGVLAGNAPLVSTANNPTNGYSNGGLVLPGGGTISQTDGASDTLPLTTEQIDKIIAHKVHSRRVDLSKPIRINLTPQSIEQIMQTDGADDQSDEINSDLDDPEDDQVSGDEDDDDDGGMIMLCLYDKVQRVKNKWKYVLKDGVANINGKDYVFSKGSGESEW